MLSELRRFSNAKIFCLLLVALSGCSFIGPKSKNWDAAGSSSEHVAIPNPASSAGRAAAETSQKLELAIAIETADLARKRGMDDEAIAQYLVARKLDPKLKGVAHPLAVLYDRAGKMDAAEREYQLAMSEQGNNADLLSDYGYFLYSRGKLTEAEATLRSAIKQTPKHHQATINLALVVGTQGHYDESQRLFTEAIGPAAALHNIGMLKLRAGDQAGAVESLRGASSQDPSLTESREVLAKLNGNFNR
ncbi:MAG TPA: hypothetical protein DDZ51_10920 [Planctomycetaceae bacterium]|nr:hypothetical protein [Planctomycetaceae bacterium]